MSKKDVYKTVKKQSQSLLIEKKSKFIANVKPVDNEDDADTLTATPTKLAHITNKHINFFIFISPLLLFVIIIYVKLYFVNIFLLKFKKLIVINF